jgi:hypothetical protein
VEVINYTHTSPAYADARAEGQGGAIATDEGIKIRMTVERIVAATSYDVLVMDDGSTDGSIETPRKLPVQIGRRQPIVRNGPRLSLLTPPEHAGGACSPVGAPGDGNPAYTVQND